MQLPSYYGLAALDAEWGKVQTTLFEITNRYLSPDAGRPARCGDRLEQYRAEFEAAGGPALEEAVNEAIREARENFG